MSWLLEDGVPNFFINSWELFQSRQSLQEKEVSVVEQNTATADQIYRCHYNEFFQKNAQLCNKASCCIPDLVTPENCSQLDFLFCQQWNRFEYLGQYSERNHCRTTENHADNQFSQAGFRPLCNKIPFFVVDFLSSLMSFRFSHKTALLLNN